MKNFIISLFFLLPILVNAQTNVFELTKQQVDSLNLAAKQTDNDTLKMELYNNLAIFYLEKNRDSSIYYAEKQLAIAKKLKQPIWQGTALTTISYGWLNLGNYSQSFEAVNEALKLAQDEASENHYYVPKLNLNATLSQDPNKSRLALLSQAYQKLAFLYRSANGNDNKAISYFLQAAGIAKSIDNFF